MTMLALTSDHPEWLKPVANFTALAVVAGIIAYGFWQFYVICDVASVQGDNGNWYAALYWLGLIVGIAYCIVSIILAMNTVDKMSAADAFVAFWEWFDTKLGLWSFVAWSCSLATIPLAVLLITHFVPYQLQTDADTVRLMQDGRVILAGSSVSANPYQIVSTAVPLRYPNVPLRLTVQSPSGVTTVSLAVSFRVEPDAAFRDMLTAHVGELMAQARTAHDVDETPHRDFFKGVLNSTFGSDVIGTIADITSGSSSGSRNASLIRLNQRIMERHPQPSWMKDVVISQIDVENVTVPDS